MGEGGREGGRGREGGWKRAGGRVGEGGRGQEGGWEGGWERAGERAGEGGRGRERVEVGVNDLTLSPLVLNLIPSPLPDFISQLWRLQSCEIKSGSGLETRLPDPIYTL